MIHVVSFSGGRTSARLVYLMEQKRQKEGWEVVYIYMDTGAEHPKTYDFIRNVVKHFGIDLICLRLLADTPLNSSNHYEVVSPNEIEFDLKPWYQMIQKYDTPMFNMPFCTDRMKTEINKNYCNDRFGRGNYVTWLGMRRDEPSRVFGMKVTNELKKILGGNQQALIDVLDACYLGDSEHVKQEIEHLSGTNVTSELAELAWIAANEKQYRGQKLRYMAAITDDSKEDVINWWSRQPFDLGIPEHLGNCVFCVKKGLNKVALAAKDEPELARKMIEMIYSPGRRILEKRLPTPFDQMYRKRTTLEGVIKMYEHEEAEDIRARLKGYKADDSECSESCEAYAETGGAL